MRCRTRSVLFALVALFIPHFAAAQDEVVEMSIRNRSRDALTVFALWDRESGTRTRLGDLGINQTRTYTTEKRGEQVTVVVQVQGQTAGATRVDRTRTRDAAVRSRGNRFEGGDRPEDFAPVSAGDKLEWEILSTDPFDIIYRAAGSAAFSSSSSGSNALADAFASLSGDVAPGEPRMSPFTVISQGGIQQAQEIEQDSLRAAAYREVYASIMEGLAQEDDNPMAYLHLGIANAGLKNYIAADSAFDRAEDIYPAYFDEEGGTGAFRLNAWLDAYTDALLKLEAQDSEGAVELFEMANMLYDRRVEAYLNIGVTAAGLGDMAKSIEAWQSAIAVIDSPDGNPGDSLTRVTWDTDFWIMSHSNLGRLLTSQGRAEEAVAVFETLLDRDPENTEARSSLAMALAQSGQADGALTVFDEILARDDGAPLDYYNAGVTLYGAGEFDKAALAFEKTIARSPMYKDALQNLVQTYFEMEDFEALVPHSQRLLELDPFNDYIHRMHVQAMAQIGHEDLVDALGVLQALPFQIDELVLQPLGAGCLVTGVAINNALDSGTALTLRFTFYDNEGNPVGTADTEVTVSDPEVAHPFDLTFDSEMQILGYSYELVG